MDILKYCTDFMQRPFEKIESASLDDDSVIICSTLFLNHPECPIVVIGDPEERK